MIVVSKIRWAINYLGWLYKYIRLSLGGNLLRDIKILSIEFSSVCNLRCKYCFIDQLDRDKFLDITIYEKLIKEIAENSKFKIKTMEWPISGEFLVYPKWREVIKITRQYMDRYPKFQPHIILNDNLMLMDEEKIDYILKSGVLKQIICSIDGHDAETFENMRPPAKFNRMKDNFNILVQKNNQLKDPVFIQINNGRDEHSSRVPFNRDMVDIFNQGDDVTFWYPKFWNESFNKKEKNFYPAKGFCTFVFNNVSLSANGHISKCCMDLKGSTVYADLSKHTLEEIWHSRSRKQFLGLMFKNRRDQIQGCSTCSITKTNNDNRFNNVSRIVKRNIVLPFKRKSYMTNVKLEETDLKSGKFISSVTS